MRRAWYWIIPLAALAALLTSEFLLFDQLGAHHHTWVYPRWNDQIQYLTECYLGYLDAQAHGLATALGHTLTNRSAQGTLHDFWAVLLFSVTGPSRSAALSLNMLAFLAWQLAVFVWIARSTKSWVLGFCAAGLLLAIRSPWAVAPGSAIDFRLDWFAAATFGLCLPAAYSTNRFRHTGFSVVFGLAVALTLLTRFLTGTYFALIYLALLVWVALPSDGRWRRIANLLLSGAVAAALAGPVFWINRETVYDYYLIGHFVGPESAIRSAHMGVWRSAEWLFGRLAAQQLGAPFLGLAVTALLAGLIASIVWPIRPRDADFESAPAPIPLFPAIVFFLSPAVLLTLHPQKTDQVLGVLIAGCFGVIAIVIARVLRASAQPARRIISGAVLLTAFAGFSFAMARNPHSAEMEEAARDVNRALDYVVTRSQQAGLDSPRIAVDRVTDSLDAQIMRVSAFERHHRWIPFLMTLPTGIEEEKVEVYWERLRRSDFVFLTAEGDSGFWPSDHQLARMRPETHQWAEENLRYVRDVHLVGVRMQLFERRDLPGQAAEPR